LLLSPLSRGPGPLFEHLRLTFTQRWFVSSFIKIDVLALEKIFFLYYKTHVNMVFPIVAPPDLPGTMIWTNLNLFYIRKLSCEYELFWLCGLW
jgi:hypothetical protein